MKNLVIIFTEMVFKELLFLCDSNFKFIKSYLKDDPTEQKVTSLHKELQVVD